MNEALKEAKKAYKENEVPVGAIIVKDGKIIARAHNLKEKKQSVIAHAEILAIQKASKKLNNWRLEKCQMYVTLRPCKMCMQVIDESRIEKIYYGSDNSEENDLSNNYIYEKSNECSEILIKFFKNLRMNN